MAKHLTEWRHGAETPWLKDAPVHPLQHALKDLERAYKNFFARRAGFPRFKRKGSGESFRYPDAKQFEIDQANSRIKLPKLGWIRYRNSREILGTAKNITIRQSAGKCYASIQTEREVEPPWPTAGTAIGIDVGIARLATLSDGSFIAPLNSFKKHQQRLARYQRRMSRKAKFSNNWKKAKIKVQKVYTQIANGRRDFLHKTTTTISKNHALVCIEDLQVRTRRNGPAARCWQCLRTTPVRPAPAAGTWRTQTDAPKPNSYVSSVGISPMRMWLAQSMF
jgi:putative transposase